MCDARHVAHDELTEPIGGMFDPAGFDPQAVTFDGPGERWRTTVVETDE
jgi:hypothetical protein